jgi:hypothetical protein
MNALDQKLDEQLDDAFDRKLNELIEAHKTLHFADDGVTNYKAVTPAAKNKLKGLLKFYAKKAHPFAACVRDNTKRFGPDRAKKVCAVLKDIIRGTTKWRGKNNPRDVGTPGVSADEFMDTETLALVDMLGELDLWELLGLVQLEEQEGDDKIELKDVPFPQRMKMAKKGEALPDGSFPIENEQDLKNAIKAVGRAKDTAKAKKHVVNRAKALKLTNLVPGAWLDETANVKLSYPIGMPEQPVPMSDADTKFLKTLLGHHQTRLGHATKYITSDPHPDVASFARDVISESTRHIERTNRMLKTGRPY